MNRGRAIAALGIVAGGVAAYAGAMKGPFVFDDLASIVNNPTLAKLWPPAAGWPPTGAVTVSGRPLLNVSLAVNHAIGGLAPAGYHWTNLLIHVAAALVLFGIVRRTLERRLPPGTALLAAMGTALLWEVHPLQTEAVTYVVQRAESLMGMFALVTLYAFILSLSETTSATAAANPSVPRRLVGQDKSGLRPGLQPDAGSSLADIDLSKVAPATRRGNAWQIGSVVACAAGMATKEVMVVIPVLVLLYDRTFVAGSFGAAWRSRRGYYVALAGTWLVLAALLISVGGGRGDSAGWSLGLTATIRYAHAQVPAVAHYLRLAVWPAPLVFDYGTDWRVSTLAWMVDAGVLLALAAATIVGLRRNQGVGFLGAWFFLTLAPSSSIVPIGTEWMAEHRMYLPLAALSTLLCCLFVSARRHAPAALLAAGMVVVAVGLGWATVVRNRDYRSAIALWSDTAGKRPANAYAHNNLGAAFLEAGRAGDAGEEFRRAVALNPSFAKARNNLGRVLLTRGDVPAARAQLAQAVALEPNFAEAHNNLGVAYAMGGDVPRAAAEFRRALAINPAYPEARRNLDHTSP